MDDRVLDFYRSTACVREQGSGFNRKCPAKRAQGENCTRALYLSELAWNGDISRGVSWRLTEIA